MEEGDVYGIVTGEPYFDLSVGRYRLQWQVDADGENLIHIGCSNGAIIKPNEIQTTAGEWKGEAEFELKDAAHNVSFSVEFSSGSWMNVINLRLYSPEYTDRAWIFAFAILVIWILLVFEQMGRILDQMWETLFVLGFAVEMICMPAFREDCLDAMDIRFYVS